MRALLTRMAAWVRDDTSPPVSAYPRIDVTTLTTLEDYRFPRVLGDDMPLLAHQAYRTDFGPRWSEGIVDLQPPEIGEPYPSLVPQVDEYGNERGGVPSVETMAPLATYLPWNPSTDFIGTYLPLARSETDRRTNGDPRPSIETLYAGREDYLELANDAARSLVQQGWLLPEDVPTVLRRAERHWDWLTAR